MKVRRFETSDDADIARFNERLKAGGVAWPVYAEGPHDQAHADVISKRLFVAEVGDEVRGAVWLHEHEFRVNGAAHRAGWAKYPVSESLVDSTYGGVPGALVIRLMREQPRLMALGMGGHGGAFARLLSSMRWTGISVPNYVRMVRPARVLRNLRYVRTTPLRRAVLDALAVTGVGWAAWRAYESWRRLSARGTTRGIEAQLVDRFGDWADVIWERTRDAYGLVARRDARMLNAMMPLTMPVERLRVTRAGADIGWAVVRRREPAENPSGAFGPLRVGLIADALADPSDALAVIRAADRYLQAREVDLIFSNQTHIAWGAALVSTGYISAPSQFAFYRSPKMSELLSGAEPGRFHINRGDCDGPMFA